MPPPEAALEDRLRGLILGNAGATGNPQVAPPSHSFLDLQRSSQSTIGVDLNGMAETKQSPSSPGQQENSIPQNGGRKKLNQSQRRQMSSHLSIPIDPRPQGRGNVFHGSHGQQWNAPRQNTQHQSHQYQNYQQSPSPHTPSPAFQSVSPLSPYDPRMQPLNQQGRSPMQNAYPPMNSPLAPREWRSEQPQGQFASRPQPHHRQLYQPGNQSGPRGRDPSSNIFNENALQAQSEFLQLLIDNHVDKIAIENSEIDQKEGFRVILERACRDAIAKHEVSLGNTWFDPATVQLKCFGSMASGFATKASDMDLALLTPFSMPRPESAESHIPRLLEKTLLDLDYGTRLLTKTRVPIIKVCERPTKALMSDLLEERRKFEQGLLTEDHSHVQVQENTEHLDDSGKRNNKRSVDLSLDEQSYERQLSSLHQKQNQSLGDYYGIAKKVLFKLGGYDTGLSGQGTVDLPPEKLKILNDVSKAFINGMSHEELKNALLNINVCFFESTEPTPVSLSGVYCQAEIERLAMKWASRRVLERSDRQETIGYCNVMEWNQLAWQAPNNPSVQNKQLYQLLDRMKRINSLQFATLEQASYEDAHQYFHRMTRLLEEPVNEPSLFPFIFAQYVKGVSDPDIQKRLLILIEGPGKEQMTEKALLFHHSVLQLAKEYERALTAGLYEESARLDVETYVSSILRGSEKLNWIETESFFENLMQSPEAIELTSRVKKLPPPTSLPKARDRYYDHLAFPPDDSVGIQCDINFTADLALINTHLLRCYAAADPRVRPLVLFVKSWASRRGINTPYRGTLSSYGYVLMVLHYLINIATPFVIPNLQLIRRPPPPHLSPAEVAALDICNGLDVRFWRDEEEIKDWAEKNLLTRNTDSMGKLLRGFFEYYANNGGGFRGFDWGREVLSLRTQGGIVTKQEKGWVGARTTTETITISHANPNLITSPPKQSSSITPPNTQPPEQPTSTIPSPKVIKVEETKEIRHRYLFAIEDPFELDHNIARTVTHNGIVGIRDEFRRAWRIIKDQGIQNGNSNGRGELLAEVSGGPENKDGCSGGQGSGHKLVMDLILEGGLKGVVGRGGTVGGWVARDAGRVVQR